MLAEDSYEGEGLSNVETVHVRVLYKSCRCCLSSVCDVSSPLCSQALHVLHVALDKLGLVGATRVDPQVHYTCKSLTFSPLITLN